VDESAPRAAAARRFAQEAAEAGTAAGLEVEIWDEERIAAEGLGCLAGVAAGSSEPPRLVRLTYRPAGVPTGHLALVGKGITFDSGGLSLKPAASMETMKSDMGERRRAVGRVGAARPGPHGEGRRVGGHRREHAKRPRPSAPATC